MTHEERLLRIASRLEELYGPIEWRSHGDPLEVLISTILSQNTNDANRDRAYESLKARFPSYEAILQADVNDLAEAIKPGGLQHQKARRIQQILRTLKAERGSFDLSYLQGLSLEEALKELLKHEGIGKKTAGIVLTFSLNKPYFPVDTHIRRIALRLRLVKRGQDPHEVMNRLVPDHLKYQLHLHLIRHGRTTCKARKPLCTQCVISDLCPTGRSNLK